MGHGRKFAACVIGAVAGPPPPGPAEASLDEVNWIIPHQANSRIIQSAAAGEFWRGADLGVGGVADGTGSG